MFKKQKTFDLDFKLQAVKMIKDQSQSVCRVSRDLKNHLSNAYRWLTKFKSSKLDKHGTSKQPTTEEQRILALENEVQLLLKQNAMLNNLVHFLTCHC